MKNYFLLKCLFIVFSFCCISLDGVKASSDFSFKKQFISDINLIPHNFKKRSAIFIDDLNSGNMEKTKELYPPTKNSVKINQYIDKNSNNYKEDSKNTLYKIHNVILIDANLCFLIYWRGNRTNEKYTYVAPWILLNNKWYLIGFNWDFRSAIIVSFKYIKNKPAAWMKPPAWMK